LQFVVLDYNAVDDSASCGAGVKCDDARCAVWTEVGVCAKLFDGSAHRLADASSFYGLLLCREFKSCQFGFSAGK